MSPGPPTASTARARRRSRRCCTARRWPVASPPSCCIRVTSAGQAGRSSRQRATWIPRSGRGWRPASWGLSDRARVDLSFDGQVAAALAVADAAGASRFFLFGASQGGQLAAAIAGRYPERAEALVVYGTCANGNDLAPAGVRDLLVALVRAHWGLGSKMLTGIFFPDPPPRRPRPSPRCSGSPPRPR